MGHKATWTELRAAPRDFAHGFLGGLLGPVLALAAAVGLTYVATRKLPAVKEVTQSDGTRHRAISLAPPLEARASWARTAGDLRSVMLELKAQMQHRG